MSFCAQNARKLIVPMVPAGGYERSPDLTSLDSNAQLYLAPDLSKCGGLLRDKRCVAHASLSWERYRVSGGGGCGDIKRPHLRDGVETFLCGVASVKGRC